MTDYRTDKAFAVELDAQDPLKNYRDEFYIAQAHGKESIYFCGNSLGLQPKRTESAIMQELKDWQKLGVEGHMHAKNPWLPYHEFLAESYAKIVGAKPSEVVAMNTLSVNLHLMMVSFYRPTAQRHKIVIENNAFPSDQYAVQSQISFHGFDPETSLIEMQPRDGQTTLQTQDILDLIEREGDSIALIMVGGVNYYTGQLFDMAAITKAGHAKGAQVGFDLAHAAGNVPLKLHEWGVDFACWCSYKYLNSGPGSVSGCFVHERHAQADLPRFNGWWGHDKETRFKMGPNFKAIGGAESWQLSNPPILSLAAVKASLEIFDEVGMDKLRKKSLKITGYMEFLLDSLKCDAFDILTPRDTNQRGAQLSIVVNENGKKVFEALEAAGVICDWREPNCIRVAPMPLYNSYADVYRFVEIFAQELNIKVAA
ncbi:MAG: kynureninase [Rickettsiales bacterium]|nr:kynureninase [Rickettsiales bacterium]